MIIPLGRVPTWWPIFGSQKARGKPKPSLYSNLMDVCYKKSFTGE